MNRSKHHHFLFSRSDTLAEPKYPNSIYLSVQSLLEPCLLFFQLEFSRQKDIDKLALQKKQKRRNISYHDLKVCCKMPTKSRASIDLSDLSPR